MSRQGPPHPALAVEHSHDDRWCGDCDMVERGVLWAAEQVRGHQCCKGRCQHGEACTAYHLNLTCAEAIARDLEGSVKG